MAVAVVSWNTRDLLAACLRSLAPAARAGLAEVWVVDNGSSDGSPELVQAEFEWARLELPGQNLGFGPAVNRVAERTETSWVAAANADIELLPGALEALLLAGDTHPEAGVLAPRLLLSDGSTQRSIHPFPTLTTAACFHLGLYRVSASVGQRLCLPSHWDQERSRRVEWATGAFLLVRREAFDEIGGFDESQWMYAEDIDLSWRLAKAGWTTRYEPSAVVRHALSAAAAQAFGGDRERALRIMRATYSWIARRRGILSAWSVALAQIAGHSLRFALLTPLALADPARWRSRQQSARRSVQLARTGLASRRSLLSHR